MKFFQLKRHLIFFPITLAILGCGDPETAQMEQLIKQVGALKQQIASLEKRSTALQEVILRPPEETSHSDDVAQVLATVRHKLEAKNYVAASDYLLAAMRIDPSSPEVFNTTLEFVRQTAASDNDEALYLANDLYTRMGGLIPFQPISRIENARKEYVAASSAFQPVMLPPAVAPRPTPSPLESIQTELEALKSAELPTDAMSLAVQSIRRDLQALATGTAFQAPGGDPEFRKRWQSANHQLDELETDVLTRLYEEGVRSRFMSWKEQATAIRKFHRNAAPKQHDEVYRRADEALTVGYQLRSETQPFAEGEIPEAERDIRTLNAQIDKLIGIRKLAANQFALVMLRYLEGKQDYHPLEKLEDLAEECHELYLSPYVRRQYEAAWTKWFEELETPQKVEATKIRILEVN